MLLLGTTRTVEVLEISQDALPCNVICICRCANIHLSFSSLKKNIFMIGLGGDNFSEERDIDL